MRNSALKSAGRLGIMCRPAECVYDERVVNVLGGEKQARLRIAFPVQPAHMVLKDTGSPAFARMTINKLFLSHLSIFV